MRGRYILITVCGLIAAVGSSGCSDCRGNFESIPESNDSEPAENKNPEAESQPSEEGERASKKDPDQMRPDAHARDKKYPNVEMVPGEVVEMAKRPRDIQALKELSRRPAKAVGNQSINPNTQPDGRKNKDDNRPR